MLETVIHNKYSHIIIVKDTDLVIFDFPPVLLLHLVIFYFKEQIFKIFIIRAMFEIFCNFII